MPHAIRMFVFCLGVSLCCATSAPASSTATAGVIDQFVAGLFPDASQYFWVVNAAQKDAPREMIVDLNAYGARAAGTRPVANRFLLLILDGKVLAAQHIPLNATVDCRTGEDV